MRTTLIHNPTAGRGHPPASDLMLALRRAGFEPDYRPTDQEGLPRSLEDPGDLVVVAGGDGTVRRVAAALVERGVAAEVALAVVPLGTANNIAHAIGWGGWDGRNGWSAAELERLAAAFDPERTRPFDAGRVRGPWGDGVRRLFFESFGVGLLATMIPILTALKSSPGWKRGTSREEEIDHDLGVLGAVLAELRAGSWGFRVDGGRERTARGFLLEVMNTGAAGPGLCFADGAVTDDGLLDLVLVEEGRREELGHSIERSRLAGGGCPVGETAFAAERCRRLELLWQGDALHLDSVLWAADGRPPFRKVEPLSLELPVRIEVEAVPAALQVLVPPA